MFLFNRHPFDLPNEKYKSFKPEKVVRKSKLKYIPLYSPVPCCRRHISDDSDHDISDETKLENSWTETSRRRSFSESSLCDVSSLSPDNSRPLTPDLNRCTMPIKRASHLSKYLNTSTPPTKRKVSSTRQKSSGRVLTSAKSIELMKEKERKSKKKSERKK